LKSAVDNPNLEVFGKINIEALPNKTFPASPTTSQFKVTSATYTVSADQKLITVNGKYNVTQVFSNLDSWEFKGEDWKYSPLTHIHVWCTKYTVKEENLPNTLTYIYMNGWNLNIEKLGHCPLTTINVIDGWRPTGSIEGYVAAQRLNGRTEGFTDIGRHGSSISGSISYGGVNINGPKSVTWTADSISVTDL
jgi:hypothetical protein